MECKLELTLIFSSDLDEIIFNNFLNEIKNLAKKEFLRGIYKANRLFINLESDRELSPLIFRLVKRLKETGRVYKYGLRDFYVPYYEVVFKCEFMGKVKLPIGMCICNGEKGRIVFTNLEKDFLRGGVDRTIKMIFKKISKKEFVLAMDNKKEVSFDGNPIEVMEKNKLIRRGLIRGENFYLIEGAKLIKEIKDRILSELNNKFKIKEIFVPPYIPLSLLNNRDIVEYVPPETFSNQVVDIKNKKKIYEYYFLFGKIPKMETEELGVILDEFPLPLYYSLKDTEISDDMFLYYLTNLKLILVFFVKIQEYDSVKKDILEFLKSLINSFELRYRILVKKLDMVWYRFQAYLPYKKTWLNLIDVCFSGDIYTKSFGIVGKSGEIVIYIENFLISEIGQKGFPSKNEVHM